MATRIIPGIIAIALLLLAAAVTAHAKELAIVSPTDGATIDPMTDGFSFSINIPTAITSCQLIIDNQTVKDMSYNSILNGHTLNLFASVDAGTHTWSVTCTAQNQSAYSTGTGSFVVQSATAGSSAVTVTSNGISRGSLTHEFKFSNSQTQQPVVVDHLAPGDFITIDLLVPPSTLTKSLYVSQYSSTNGKKFLLLQDQKTYVDYTLYQGENATINISSSSVILSYQGITLNRATVIAYPRQSPSQPTVTDETDGNSTGAAAPDLNADQSNASEGQQTPTTTQPTTPSTPPQNPPSADQNANNSQQNQPPQAGTDTQGAQQGWFKRFLSWLASLFGA